MGRSTKKYRCIRGLNLISDNLEKPVEESSRIEPDSPNIQTCTESIKWVCISRKLPYLYALTAVPIPGYLLVADIPSPDIFTGYLVQFLGHFPADADQTGKVPFRMDLHFFHGKGGPEVLSFPNGK